MDLVLTRDPGQLGPISYGVLSLGGFQTLELAWRPWQKLVTQRIALESPELPQLFTDVNSFAEVAPCGLPDNSCVPPGIYQLELHNTPKHPFTWALVNHALGIYHEPGDIPLGMNARSAVLLHTGNTALDSEGCILVGLERTNLWQPPGVFESVKAFQQLKANLPWVAGHTLTIQGPGSTP